jgi:hypothetical protein
MAYTTIKKPSDYFNTKLYTGTGATQNITGVGFEPDLVWLRRRDAAGRHRLFDAVRGATKSIRSDDAEAEITRADSLTSFDSDGFTLGADSSSGGINVNISGETMVGWSWRGSDSSAVSNTDGSITSTVSANTTSGFSIVSYTGTGTQPSTVGHGLGVTPKMFIVKPRTDAQSWCVYHESVGAGYVTYLDITSGSGGSSVWNSTSPTSSVFTVNDNQVNSSGITYIAYCFAEKKGFSKFGSYTGNGNADGTFVYLGFKPAFLMLKNTSSTGNWVMYDDKRSAVPDANINNRILYANSSVDYEIPSGSRTIDTLSNGFKLRGTAADTNTSGNSYIYMAFAEEPLVGDNPCTAR